MSQLKHMNSTELYLKVSTDYEGDVTIVYVGFKY